MKIRKLCLSIALCLSSALSGCESPPSQSVDLAPPMITPEQACPDLIKAYCTKALECYPIIQVLQFPDVATCAARINLTCPQLVKAMGSSVTGADLQACTPKLAGASCPDYLMANGPVRLCGFKPGTLTDGTACGEDVQCQSLYCKKATGMDCGKCTAIGKTGSVCTETADCDKGLVCAGAAGAKLCTAYLPTGASCTTTSNSVSCQPLLACRNGSCATTAKLGESCSTLTQDCDGLSGLSCSVTNKCVTPATAQLGGACGVQGTTYIACIGGTFCEPVSKKCIAPAADGATCNETTGPRCQSPAKCVASVCKIADPTLCK